MATVNITPPLRKLILGKVAEPFGARYKEASKASREDSLFLYDTLMITPAQNALLRQIPDKWIRLSDSKQFNQTLFVGHEINDAQRMHYLQLDLPKDERFYDYSWTYAPHSSAHSVEHVNSTWPAANLRSAGLSKDYITPLEAIVAERDQLIATVEKMLNSCKTLNQLEKVWPAIRKYCDADVCARLDKKAERKRSTVDIGVTDEELQTLSVHHIRQQMTA